MNKSTTKRAQRDDARLRVNEAREDSSRAPRMDDTDIVRRGEEVLSESDLRELIRSEFIQEALPTVKPPPGWHYCWLSATSSYDTLPKRMRIGYQPVTYAELAEQGQESLEQYKIAGGNFDGGVMCNEMILFKLPMERYQLIMSEFHHNMPLEEERTIRERATPEVEDRQGRQLVEVDKDADGMKSLGADKPAPTFA